MVLLTFVKVVRDTITDFDRHDHDHKCSVKSCDDHGYDHDDKGYDHSGKDFKKDYSRGYDKDDCKNQFDKFCGKARSMGFFPGGGIPNAQEGLIPGTFIGPTLIFPGVLNPGIPTKLPPANRTSGVQSTQVQINPSSGRY